MKAKGTTHWRIHKSLANTLKRRFPAVPQAALLEMMYKTSAIRLEGVLKEKDATNKVGKFLYGKKIWKTK